MKSKLIKRIYYGIEISLDTPVCVSNGESEMTDKDVLKDWEGKPFIPGTSFAFLPGTEWRKYRCTVWKC